MAFYPKKIEAEISNRGKCELIENADSTETEVNFSCGVALEFSFKIREKVVSEINYRTNGCGYVVAYASYISKLIKGKSLFEIHGVDSIRHTANAHFGEPEFGREHCVNLCFDALSKALGSYRRKQIEEWNGEKSLICSCFGIDEETIEFAVKNNGLRNIEMVGEATNAGTGCGSCQFLIMEIIDANLDS